MKIFEKDFLYQKKTKNKTYYEGIYETRNEAKKRIQQLKRKNKMINNTSPLKTKVIPESMLIEKYGVSQKYQVFRKKDNGKIKKYAVFDTLEEAKDYVSYMYSRNWHVKQEINTTLTNNDTDLDIFQKKCGILIQQEKKTHPYGVYDTWKEATRIVNFLSTLGLQGKIIEFHSSENKNLRLPREVRYCNKVGSKYILSKRLYKQHYIYGAYPSKRETRKQIEILNTYSWDTKQSIEKRRIMKIDQQVDFIKPEKQYLNCRL